MVCPFWMRKTNAAQEPWKAMNASPALSRRSVIGHVAAGLGVAYMTGALLPLCVSEEAAEASLETGSNGAGDGAVRYWFETGSVTAQWYEWGELPFKQPLQCGDCPTEVEAALNEGTPPADCASVTVVEGGWPLYAVRGYLYDLSTPDVLHQVVQAAVVLNPNYSPGEDSQIIPLAPIWSGLVANGMLFAIVTTAGHWALNALRMHRRRAASKCVNCGHSATGNASGTCAECGCEVSGIPRHGR